MAPLEAPSNRSYSASISNKEAEVARAIASEAAPEVTLFPVAADFATLMPEGMTSGLQNPAQSMNRLTGMKVGMGNALEIGVRRSTDRRSLDEILSLSRLM